MKKLSLILALALAALALSAAAASAAKVRNGGFEHDLRGWTQNSSGEGAWFPQPSGTEPSGLMAPKRGRQQAITEQGGPGARILTQTVKLKGKRRHRLSMWVQYDNQADHFASPDTFWTGSILARSADADRPRGDSTDGDNQQLRIEVLRAKARARTTNHRQILATVLRTMPGDPMQIGWTRFHVKLNKYAGKRVKLRLAEIDNIGEFYVGVDDVKIKSKRKRKRR